LVRGRGLDDLNGRLQESLFGVWDFSGSADGSFCDRLLFRDCIARSDAGNLPASASAPTTPAILFSASIDWNTGQDVIEDHSTAASAEGQQAAAQQQYVIDRIDFVGNRRVRKDTLTARIFTREGDNYNEETLRRDFKRCGTRSSLRT